MYKVIYEIVFNKTTERYVIQDYVIKYSNCDYIHAIDISKDIRKIEMVDLVVQIKSNIKYL